MDLKQIFNTKNSLVHTLSPKLPQRQALILCQQSYNNKQMEYKSVLDIKFNKYTLNKTY